MTKTGTAAAAAISAAATAAFLLVAWHAVSDGGPPADSFGPDDRKAPDSWYSETSERPDSKRTTSEYETDYADCTLRLAKDGTGTDVISFWLHMECAGEHGVPSTYGNDTHRYHFMTVPADFEASWPDSGDCQMALDRTVWDSGDATSSGVRITCLDW